MNKNSLNFKTYFKNYNNRSDKSNLLYVNFNEIKGNKDIKDNFKSQLMNSSKRNKLKINIDDHHSLVKNTLGQTNPLNFNLNAYKNEVILENSITKYSNKSTFSFSQLNKTLLNPITFNDKNHWKNIENKIENKKMENKFIIWNYKKNLELYNQNFIEKLNKSFELIFNKIWLEFLNKKENNKKFILRKESNKIYNCFKKYLDTEINEYLNKKTQNIFNDILIKHKLEKEYSLNSFSISNNDELVWKYKELKFENYLWKINEKQLKLESYLNKLEFIKDYKKKFIKLSNIQLEEFKISLLDNSNILTKLLVNWKKNLKYKNLQYNIIHRSVKP